MLLIFCTYWVADQIKVSCWKSASTGKYVVHNRQVVRVQVCRSYNRFIWGLKSVDNTLASTWSPLQMELVSMTDHSACRVRGQSYRARQKRSRECWLNELYRPTADHHVNIFLINENNLPIILLIDSSLFSQFAESSCCLHNFHIRIVHLDIIKILFIHQLMHKWVVLKRQY